MKETEKETKKLEKKSFNDLLITFGFASRNPSMAICPSRQAAHQKLLNIFLILYNSNLEDKVIEDLGDFYKRYSFPFSKENPKSLADYLITIGLIASDYSVYHDHQKEYNYYIQAWKEFTDLCIYEKIEGRSTSISYFKSFVMENARDIRLELEEIIQDS